MSRATLAKVLLGLVGLVLLGGLVVRTADPDQRMPAGHQHGGAAPAGGDISWPLLAGPTGVAATFALATAVFWVASRRRGRHAAVSRRRQALARRRELLAQRFAAAARARSTPADGRAEKH